MKIKPLLLLFSAALTLPTLASTYKTIRPATNAIEVDGIATEKEWSSAQWRPIDQILLGYELKPEDFSGRFKLLWDAQHLYLLAEIKDDQLSDVYPDPLEKYWDEECVEVFVDENASGGIHTYNHNAFAYHVALDNQVVDIDVDEKPKLFNDHIESQWKNTPDGAIWEMAIKLFPDTYQYGGNNQPVELAKNKTIGFMLAYCDADGKGNREHFIGSEVIEGDDKNRGYIDASVFGKYKLVD
ncbi:MAG: sugar-binding protein [Alteromonadaceae bacterium]|nr:sugar-binding protein [Alteromonadaceae bacterium]